MNPNMDYPYISGSCRHHQFLPQMNANNNPGMRGGRQGQGFQQAPPPPNLGRSPSQPFAAAPAPPHQPGGFHMLSQLRAPNAFTSNNQFNFPLRSERTFPPSSNTGGSKPRRQHHQQQQQFHHHQQQHHLNSQPGQQQSSQEEPCMSQKTDNSPLNNKRTHDNDSISAGSVTQQGPQYRIFKRGDNIPGISSPIDLTATTTTGPTNNNNNGIHTNSTGATVATTITTTTSSDPTSSSLGDDVIFNTGVGEGANGNVKVNAIDATLSTTIVTSTQKVSVNGNDFTNSKETDISHEESETNSSNSVSGISTANNNNLNSNFGRRGQVNRTSISLVTDLARFHGLNAEYRLTNETGPPHAPTFTVVLTLGTEEYQAQGSSIKKAQMAAASLAMEQTSLHHPPPRAQPKKTFQPGGKVSQRRATNWSITQLNALAEELGETVTFVSQPVPMLNQYNRGGSKVNTQPLVAIHVGDQVFSGEGPTLNAAKNSAAMAALKALIQMKKAKELEKVAEQQGGEGVVGDDGSLLLEEQESLDTDIKSPISIVHEMALKRGLKVTFDIAGEEGPPHMKVFTIKCCVGALETNGIGPTKQQAKKASCEAMITKLKEIPLKQPKTTLLKSIQNGLKTCTKQKLVRKKPTTPVIKEIEKQIVSPISRLLQIAHIRKYKEPEFILIKTGESDQVAPNPFGGCKDKRQLRKKKPFFTIQVTVGPYECLGSGTNKKLAKKAAADSALVRLGYTPTSPTMKSAKENECQNGNDAAIVKDATVGKVENISSNPTSHNSDLSNGLHNNHSNSNNKTDLDPTKITCARQIVPGVLVLKTGTGSNPSASVKAAAQEMVRMNSMTAQQPSSYQPLDGIRKLSYLADLLGIGVSYSDFPKKNEFLSVASLGTNPPHVAHGIGPTREEAQNSAAILILEELSKCGLDNVNSGASSVPPSSANQVSPRSGTVASD